MCMCEGCLNDFWLLRMCRSASGLRGLNVTLALVVVARDTSDGVLLLFASDLVGGLLPLLGHGLDGGTTVGAHEVVDTSGNTEGDSDTGEGLGTLAGCSDGLAGTVRAERNKVGCEKNT